MIKVVYCITKKPGMTDADFFHYWRNVHGPIGAKIPGLKRFVQSHAVRAGDNARAGDYDGMAELWFENIEALLAARQSPEWQASTEDEANFIDHKKVAYFVSREHEIVLRR
ncbi:MAG: EthD domain-containing protein [bacterium]